MKKTFFLTSFLLFGFSISCSNNENNNNKVTINKVYDGDTFYDQQNNSYRLFGIDTPEICYHNASRKSEGLEYLYAKKARDYVQKLILNKEVHIENIKKDKYERTISKVKVYNEDLALNLVKNGLARVAYISLNSRSPFYTRDFSYYQKLLTYQYEAYKKEKGFWAKKNFFKKIFPKS